MKNILVVILLVLLSSLTSIYGHVNMVYPQGGETFLAGEIIQITWEETIPHDSKNWDVLLSTDDGQTWDTIQANIDITSSSFVWNVPDNLTQSAKIQIVQDNAAPYNDYYGISKPFTIERRTSNQGKLFIPPILTGEEINLYFKEGQTSFYDGFLTNTYGYNQNYLGPTLLLEKNRAVTLNVTNELDEITTVHWHGLHVSPENDGGPHTLIEAGQTWSPSFIVLDEAATYWYHPHLHEHTEEQVTKGGAGFIIVKDELEAQLDLPRTYGIDDFPIVIQSRAFDDNKQLVINTASDDVILTNGTLDAYLDLPAQVIRLRLLNGSTERVYNLGLEGNRNFYQIASDGGLLNAPISMNRLQLVPGERAEILLDLSDLEGQSLNLMSFASELSNGIYGASRPSVMPMGSITGYTANSLNGNDFTVLQLKVAPSTGSPVTRIPSTLIETTPYVESTANATRNLTFQPAQMGPSGMVNGPFLIDGRSFDLNFTNYEIPINNTEIWELTNRTAIAHPFHIHDVQFYVLDINGQTPPPNMRGRKDVVLVPPMGGSVRFITRFDDFADKDTPYMYHCHMLSHEDDGMMGQFIVFDNSTSTIENNSEPINIYPNPTSNKVYLSGLVPATIELYNAKGQLLEQIVTTGTDETISLKSYSNGFYYLRITSRESNHAYKIVKH